MSLVLHMDPFVLLEPRGIHKGSVAFVARVRLDLKMGLYVAAQLVLPLKGFAAMGAGEGARVVQLSAQVGLLVAVQRLRHHKGFPAILALEAARGAGGGMVTQPMSLQLVGGERHIAAGFTRRVPRGIGVRLCVGGKAAV